MNKNWGFISFWISIVTVIAVIALWVYVLTTKNNSIASLGVSDVMITLLGCLVTFSVGWQIYNVLELKNKQEQINSKINELDNLTDVVKKQEIDIQLNAEKSKRYLLQSIFYSSLNKNDHVEQFVNVHVILLYDISVSQFNDKIVEDMEQLRKLACLIQNHSEILYPTNYDLLKQNEITIKQSPLYSSIKDDYEKIMKSFYSKVVSKENH